MKTLHDKEYSWEDLYDLERDVYEAIESSDIPGEYAGTIRVVMTYHPLRWGLYRQDDNGHQFLIGIFDDSAEAETARDNLEAKGHKQMYWVEEIYE